MQGSLFGGRAGGGRARRRAASMLGALVVALKVAPAAAGEVAVMAAELDASGAETWRVSVTLEHADTGWDHYADAWRVVGADGTVLGTRTLYHPHENEQPFTRSLDGVRIPEATRAIVIEARDNVHGWSPQRLEVDLSQATGGRIRVER